MNEPIDLSIPFETHPILMDLFADLLDDFMRGVDMYSKIEIFISALENARPRTSGFIAYFTTIRVIGDRLVALRGVLEVLSASDATYDVLWESRQGRLNRIILAVGEGKEWAISSLMKELRQTWRAANRLESA
jgi:hypothetical protein